MKHSNFFRFIVIGSLLVAIMLLLHSCANRGSGPQGGPKDETPPKVVKSTPNDKARQHSSKQIIIEFNELISIENAYKNVVISPTQKKQAVVKALGKKAVVTFQDSLLENTTYSIDFGNSIVDYNEKNVLKDFQFSFSTGADFDTLQISGIVLDAHTLKAMSGISVGIYKTDNDTAFETTPFMRMTKTKEDGSFVIRNIKEGKYKLYALNDVTQTYFYKQIGTDIAFCDSILQPDVHMHGKIDTIWSDSLKTKFDSLIVDAHTEYYPKDLILKSFKENPIRHFFKKCTRNGKNNFTLTFGATPLKQPVLTIIDSTEHSNWYVQEKAMRADSLTYWITDSLLYKQDTLKLSLIYLKTDSTSNLIEKTDTINMVVTNKSSKKRNKYNEVDNQNLPLSFVHNIVNDMEVYDTLSLNFEEPITEIVKDSIQLFIKKDTIWTQVPFELIKDDSLCTKKLKFLYKKSYGDTYKLNVDSASIRSMYGRTVDKFYKTFRIKQLEEYGNLFIKLPDMPQNGIIELLNQKDQCVQTAFIEDNKYIFQDIKPGPYYIRLIIDENVNGKWDTGIYKDNKQAELVYYYPKQIKIRANWDIEEEWPYNSIPWEKQRPEELKINDSKK
ncbi:MAG: Ig-like domain-containing protein [Paludibacteraceae bacterium]|nr:Ig-like domain-containing protein [Paludibacteraceae bacterium]